MSLLGTSCGVLWGLLGCLGVPGWSRGSPLGFLGEPVGVSLVALGLPRGGSGAKWGHNGANIEQNDPKCTQNGATKLVRGVSWQPSGVPWGACWGVVIVGLWAELAKSALQWRRQIAALNLINTVRRFPFRALNRFFPSAERPNHPSPEGRNSFFPRKEEITSAGGKER